jgi:hypothetical protein
VLTVRSKKMRSAVGFNLWSRWWRMLPCGVM